MDDYKFGIFKPKLKFTKQEWEVLRNTIAWQIDILFVYPFIVVKCPHCGAHNVHNITRQNLNTHKVCKLQPYKGNYVEYLCPGYKLGIFVD